jgi:hypothetical protein
MLKATCYLPVGYPTEFVAVCIQADREGNRKAVQRVGDRRGPEGNGEHSALD